MYVSSPVSKTLTLEEIKYANIILPLANIDIKFCRLCLANLFFTSLWVLTADMPDAFLCILVLCFLVYLLLLRKWSRSHIFPLLVFLSFIIRSNKPITAIQVVLYCSLLKTENAHSHCCLNTYKLFTRNFVCLPLDKIHTCIWNPQLFCLRLLLRSGQATLHLFNTVLCNGQRQHAHKTVCVGSVCYDSCSPQIYVWQNETLEKAACLLNGGEIFLQQEEAA